MPLSQHDRVCGSMALIPKQMRHVASQWSIPLNEPRKRFPIHLCPTPGLACCRRLNLATLPMPRPTYPSSERRRTDFSFNPKIVPFNPCICTFISQHKPRYHNSIPHNNVYTTAISNVRVTSSNLHRCFIVPTLSPLVWANLSTNISHFCDQNEPPEIPFLPTY